MGVTINPRSLRVDALIALVWAIFIAATGRSISAVLLWEGASEYWAHWSDDIFTGVVAGIVTFVALRNNSAKRVVVQRRLRELVEMNHNIRNALQVIGSSHLAGTEASRLQMVADSVERIEKTLREFNGGDASARLIAAKNALKLRRMPR